MQQFKFGRFFQQIFAALSRLLGYSGEVSPSLPSVSLPASSGSRVSPAGIRLIKHYEGLSLKAYRDIVGVWTIGYGDTENVTPGMVITEAEAQKRLSNRINRDFLPGVLAAITRKPEQFELDAMVSLAYNVGVGAFRGSTLVKLFNAGDMQGAADQFPRWDKAGGKSVKGLRRRRAAERAMFMGADISIALAVGDNHD